MSANNDIILVNSTTAGVFFGLEQCANALLLFAKPVIASKMKGEK